MGTSKKKNIDHQGKEICGYEGDHINNFKCKFLFFIYFIASQKITVEEK